MELYNHARTQTNSWFIWIHILGAPPELAEKMMQDCKAMVCIKADGPFHCHSFKSSVLPMDMSFKVGEEFCFPNPIDPTDVQKVNDLH